MHLILARTPYSSTEEPEAVLEAAVCQRPDESAAGIPSPLEAKGGKFPTTEAKRFLDTLPSPALLSGEAYGGTDALSGWLAASDTVHLLLLHSRPETAIARAISDPVVALEDAVEEWAEETENLLHVVRQNRKRATLFDADAATANPKAFRTACAEQLGLTSGEQGKEGSEPASVSADGSAPPGEIQRVIAAQAVAQSTRLQDLRDELEASSVPLETSRERQTVDCDAALRELREVNHQAEQTAEENELLLLQLHQVQEELENYYLEAQEKAEEVQKLTKRRNELKDEKKRLEKEKKRLEKVIADIKGSISWKLTAPLRAASGIGRRIAPKGIKRPIRKIIRGT